jgi:hypothetical protein
MSNFWAFIVLLALAALDALAIRQSTPFVPMLGINLIGFAVIVHLALDHDAHWLAHIMPIALFLCGLYVLALPGLMQITALPQFAG